ncbi:MAG: TIM barrel protein [Candidatus Latescibacteria bacterium]|nr:TIM barrel protein [Candidatus Latescibacterota bacterium]
MRLGVVGMMPADFRQITAQHLDAVRALKLSGAAFHAAGDQLAQIQSHECRKVRDVFGEAGMDLVQFGIGYGECLFDPDLQVRQGVLGKIERGIEVAAQLEAHYCLIRTGSLSPKGSYSPTLRNMESDCLPRLVETLRAVAHKAEEEGVTIVIETHNLTIMDSPETNVLVVETVGSERLQVVMDYVNHFQSLQQVYRSVERLHHIFDLMGPIAPVGHCKDLKLGEGLVLHLDEAVPGEGVLDLKVALQRWESFYPDGYLLLEHLPDSVYPAAAANTHRIAAEAGVRIY